MSSVRPLRILSEIATKYPKAWKKIGIAAENRGTALPNWEPWCYVPLAASYAVVSDQIGSGKVPAELIQDVAQVGALAAWRLSKGIYRFDPDLFESVWQTPIPGKLPVELFYRLPEYCLYIETPGKILDGEKIHGFFVHLEDDVNDHHAELRFLFDFEDDLLPYMVHLDPEGVLESLRKTRSHYRLLVHEITNELLEALSDKIAPFLSLILYICSANAEMVNSVGQTSPIKPTPKKIKSKTKLFAAKSVETWNVGLRIGSILRSARQREREEQAESRAETDIDSTETSEERIRKKPISHTRAAHWHSFWTGPRKDESRRKLILKWVNMTVVNADAADSPAVLHQVKGGD